MEQTTVMKPLTKHDRCDAARCGASAQVRFIPKGEEGELLFCGHHGRMHQPVLIQQGVIEGDLW